MNGTVHLLRNLYIGLVPLYLWICRILKRLRYENLQILSLRTQCSLEIFIYTSPDVSSIVYQNNLCLVMSERFYVFFTYETSIIILVS